MFYMSNLSKMLIRLRRNKRYIWLVSQWLAARLLEQKSHGYLRKQNM